MSKIENITPIKNGMSQEEATKAIITFLKENLDNKIIPYDQIESQECKSEPRLFQVITLKDGSQWVQGDNSIQRLIGANYLSKALKDSNLNAWQAVETKVILNTNSETIKVNIKKLGEKPLENILTINSPDFISFSRYVGKNKPQSPDLKSKVTECTGFTDMEGNANLRLQQDGVHITYCIIDTEYGSYSGPEANASISNETAELLGGMVISIPLSELI